jgi:hypothetical protein
MSSFRCPVVRLETIKPHPNADRLEIAEVFGWQTVVGKGEFVSGDKAVYVPVDSVIPFELAEKLKITQHLKHGSRVRAARLRGEMSYGFLFKCPEDLKTGEDAASFYGITKWEPEEKVSFRGKQVGKRTKFKRDWWRTIKHLLWPLKGAIGRIKQFFERCKFNGKYTDVVPGFDKYTDIENIKNFPKVIDYENEVLVVTEKIHGTNFRCGWIDGVWYVGSLNKVRIETKDDLYWKASKLYDLKNILKEGEILYGEIYGEKIQKLGYGVVGFDVRFFDLKRNGNYVDWKTFWNFLTDNKLYSVPIAYVGKLSLDDLKFSAKGKTFLNCKHIREGVVVKPIVERCDPRLGRVILKVINDDYLLGNFDEGGH